MDGRVRISVLEEEVGLEELRTEWNQLLNQSSSDTVFLTWEWVTSWWRSYGNDRDLFIIRVERNGELLGLVPLYRAHFCKSGLVRWRSLHLIGDGSGDSYYLDIIATRGYEELVARSVVAFLLNHRHSWDVLFLNEIPDGSSNLRLLQRFFEDESCYWMESEVPCTEVPLPSDWNEYLRGLDPRMRTKIRSLTRRLEDGYRVRFDSCGSVDDLENRLDSLFDMHQRRWSMKGQQGVFVLPERRRFYRDMSRLFLARGWLRLYSLGVGDHYVAHQFCFEYRRRMNLLQEAFDPQWAEYGVGNVLRGYVFRDCVERKTLFYDFLGGDSRHKQSWGARSKRSVRATIGPRTSKNHVYFGVPVVVGAVKSIMKRMIL